MFGYTHETLKENFEWMYLQAFVIDSIITETEDWLNDHNIVNDYDPRMGNKYHCTFHIGSESYNWSIDMWNKNSLTNPGVVISIDQIGMLDPSKPHSQPVLIYHFGFPHLKETPSPDLYVDDDIFKEYKEIIDRIIKKRDEIEKLMKVPTNEGSTTSPTYVVDDFIHRFNMELSWMKSKEYVSERMSMDHLMRLEDQDLNYNKTIYRFEDRNPAILARFYARVKDHWMFGKLHRIENINLNGLLYIENMDLQDISECGYDTIDKLVAEGYKIIEIVDVVG